MSELPVRQVLPELFVAPQLGPEHMAEVARLGFRSVINNRPDFEHGPGQPEQVGIAASAEAAGMNYRFLPVDGGYQSPEEIEQMAALMAELPKPILAFCRSGARSARLALAAHSLG
jgi:uncharacterized protein (TIGR01244 family)